MIDQIDTIETAARPAEVPEKVEAKLPEEDAAETGSSQVDVAKKVAELDEAERAATDLLDTDEAKETIKKAAEAAKDATRTGAQPTQVAAAAEVKLAGGPPAPAEGEE